MSAANLFKLVQTCGGCPEQYDVFLSSDPETKVGYMRLRHGHFRAEHMGEVVYEASPRGDGTFEWDERDRFLNAACKAIKAAMEEADEEEMLFYIVEKEYDDN